MNGCFALTSLTQISKAFQKCSSIGGGLLLIFFSAGCGTTAVTPGSTPVTPGPKGQTSLSVAYVANVSDNNISGYVINSATGVLTSIGGATTAGQQPMSIAITPSGKYVYVSNISSNDVSAYSTNVNTGALTPVPGSPFAVQVQPSGMAIDPQERFLFVPNYLSNDISVFQINAANGALTPVPGSPFASPTEVIEVAVNP